jgi:hypothetical protein
MNDLPNELRRSIITHLSLPSLKNLRLTSHVWATLGEEYLISPHFSSFPHQPSITRLSALSDSQKYSHLIQSLHFNHAELKEYHARNNIYFLQFVQDPEARLESLTTTWAAYAPIKAQKEVLLAQDWEVDVLTPIFGKLINLSSIAVTLMACPFPEGDPGLELLRSIWGITSTRLLPRVATTERFSNILTAVVASSSSMTLRSLSHDRLPFEFFAQKSIVLNFLSTAFHSLTKLELAVDYSELPNNLHSATAFQSMAHFLGAAEKLQSLELCFLGRQKLDIARLLAPISELRNAFIHLLDLKLCGILATETELGGFITGLKKLKRLQLGNLGLRGRHQLPVGGVHLRVGSVKALLKRLLDEMELEDFYVQGDLVGLESGENWVLEELEKASELSSQPDNPDMT